MKLVIHGADAVSTYASRDLLREARRLTPAGCAFIDYAIAVTESGHIALTVNVVRPDGKADTVREAL